ncbi:hypothetical protein RJT34_31866 [Clitoria ternatea]|uniref:Uncharacterized protein n=1 Tax=Clitoria ternatea TaxID=43366 RepID=A0AAN9EX66_CLITE
MITINKLLLAKTDKFPCSQKVSTFKCPSCVEASTRTTRTLIPLVVQNRSLVRILRKPQSSQPQNALPKLRRCQVGEPSNAVKRRRVETLVALSAAQVSLEHLEPVTVLFL